MHIVKDSTSAYRYVFFFSVMLFLLVRQEKNLQTRIKTRAGGNVQTPGLLLSIPLKLSDHFLINPSCKSLSIFLSSQMSICKCFFLLCISSIAWCFSMDLRIHTSLRNQAFDLTFPELALWPGLKLSKVHISIMERVILVFCCFCLKNGFIDINHICLWRVSLQRNHNSVFQ